MELLNSFLWPSNIPLYVCKCVCVCVCVYTYIYHIFFIHSSIDGYKGCSHVLATVNSAAMSVELHVSFWIIVLSRYMLRNGIAGSYVLAFIL